MSDFFDSNIVVLEEVFKTYNRPLLYFAHNMVREQGAAEEIVSDSFVKLWKARGQFPTQENIKAFLYIATKNACLNYLKSVHAQQRFEYDVSDNLLFTEPEIYAKIVRAELMQCIYQEVEKLPEKQQAVFRLSYLEGLDTDEISAKLGMSASAVFANRSRAIETLRKTFKDKNLLWCLLLLNEITFFLN